LEDIEEWFEDEVSDPPYQPYAMEVVWLETPAGKEILDGVLEILSLKMVQILELEARLARASWNMFLLEKR
jgi:hypothetical protein